LPKLVQGAQKLRAHQAEVALDAPGAADHHMVGARLSLGRNDLAGERAKAPLHAVADDRSADLLGYSEADAHRRIRILTIADEKDKAGRGRAPAGVRGKEIGALLDRV
jgi:hypothetical protein